MSAPATQETCNNNLDDQRTLGRENSTSSNFMFPCNQLQYLEQQREERKLQSPSPELTLSFYRSEGGPQAEESETAKFAAGRDFTKDEQGDLEALMAVPHERAIMELFRLNVSLRRDMKALEDRLILMMSRLETIEPNGSGTHALSRERSRTLSWALDG